MYAGSQSAASCAVRTLSVRALFRFCALLSPRCVVSGTASGLRCPAKPKRRALDGVWNASCSDRLRCSASFRAVVNCARQLLGQHCGTHISWRLAALQTNILFPGIMLNVEIMENVTQCAVFAGEEMQSMAATRVFWPTCDPRHFFLNANEVWI